MNPNLIITSTIACLALLWLQGAYQIPTMYVLFIAVALMAKIAVFFKYFKNNQ